MPNKNSIESEKELALNWQVHATIEAMLDTEETGKPIKVTVTEKLIDKHKTNAKDRLKNLIQREVKKGRVEELKDLMCPIHCSYGDSCEIEHTRIKKSYILDRLEELENDS